MSGWCGVFGLLNEPTAVQERVDVLMLKEVRRGDQHDGERQRLMLRDQHRLRDLLRASEQQLKKEANYVTNFTPRSCLIGLKCVLEDWGQTS